MHLPAVCFSLCHHLCCQDEEEKEEEEEEEEGKEEEKEEAAAEQGEVKDEAKAKHDAGAAWQWQAFLRMRQIAGHGIA